MADRIDLKLDTASFLRSLDLSRREFEAAAAKALNRTGFEVRDALRREAESVFDLTNRGKTLLTGATAYQLRPAKPGALVAEVVARPKTAELLGKHVTGGVFGVDSDTLQAESKRAIPVKGLRGRSGRVAKKLEPVAVLAPGGKGFLSRSGRAVLQRTGKRRGALRVLFALAAKVTIPKRFRFEDIATATARAVLPEKMRQEFAKIRARR